jgi:hypothetical protein
VKGTKVAEARRAIFKRGNRPMQLFNIVMQHTSDGSIERNDAAAVGPMVKPDSELLAKDCVKLQLDALSSNNNPRLDHGLEVLYNFANAEGTLGGDSLPSYFGYAADLYHFGHFALKFKTRYPRILNLKGYEILSCEEFLDPNQTTLRARVLVKIFEQENNSSLWEFMLSKEVQGLHDPCWLTDSLLRKN